MGQQLGTYIQQLRTTRRLGVNETARRAGCTSAHLSLIEHGQREASLALLYPLVKALDGNFMDAVVCLVLDAGIPEDAVRSREAPG